MGLYCGGAYMQGAYISDVNWVIYLGAYIWGDIWGVLTRFYSNLSAFCFFRFRLLSVTSNKVCHFADETNLLLINKLLKKSSLKNHDLAIVQ